MSALSVALSAVVLMAGLLIASAIMAVETQPPTPYAQMNRVLYPKIVVAVPRYVPRRVAVGTGAEVKAAPTVRSMGPDRR